MALKKIIISQRAIDNLFEIESYILSRFGKKSQIEFQELFESIIKLLLEFPKGYPYVEEGVNIRKCVMHKNTSILL